MKIGNYTAEQLQKMIERLESFRGTRQERGWDKRYIKAYRDRLRGMTNSENTVR